MAATVLPLRSITTARFPDITYTVSDGAGGTDTSKLTLTVSSVNDAPVAANDGSIVTAPNTPATGNVISPQNAGDQADTDVDGDTLSVTQFVIDTNGDGTPDTILVPPGGTGSTPLTDANGKDIGTLAISSNGAYSFTPAPAYDGPVPTATYTIIDGQGGNATADLSFSDVPNTAPVAQNDGPIVTKPNTPASGNVITPANVDDKADTDADGDLMTVTQFVIDADGDGLPDAPVLVPAGGSTSVTLTVGAGVTIGSLEIASDGKYTFTPAAAYDGPVPVATYTISDGTDTATAKLSFADVPNTAPVANADGPVPTLPNTTATGNVLNTDAATATVGDTDADGDKLTVTQFEIVGVTGSFNAGVTATIPNVGSLVINADGSFNFTPVNTYDGPVPVATYTISDGTATTTATLTFADVPNTAPVANADGPIATLPNTPATGNVLNTDAAIGTLGDTDGDGDNLTVTQFEIAGVAGTFNAGITATIPNVGTLIINADGSFIFTPAKAYDGPVPIATYTISDGTDTAQATLTFADVPNTAPVAVNDGPIVTAPNTPATGNVLTNDTDTDLDLLNVTEFTIAGQPNAFTAGSTATIPGVGSLVINSDGSYTFTPNPAYDGPVPVVTYTMTDGTAFASATLSFANVPNTPPVAVNDGPAPTKANTPAIGNVLSNDTDADGDKLAVTVFSIAGITTPFKAGDTATIPGIGTLQINSDGSYTFTPDQAYDGPVPVATYTMTDGTDSATANLIFADVPNTPPVAVNDGPATTAPNTPATGNVLSNDTDADGDKLIVTVFSIAGITTPFTAGDTATIPGIGSLQINTDGSYIFTPNSTYDGPVPVATYTMTDGTNSATANLTFANVPNTPPVALNDGPTATVPNAPASGNVLSNDTDADGDLLTVTQFTIAGLSGSFTAGTPATIPNVGTLVINVDGSYTFTPNPTYDGPVPVATYTVSDGTDFATASLTFADVPNTPPVAGNDGPATTAPNTPATGNVLSNDTDADRDPLTVTVFTIAGITTPFNAGDIATIPGVGSLQINNDGSYIFTPAPAYDGPVPVATYTVSDGTDFASATLSFASVPNTPPVAVNDGPILTTPGSVATGNVLTGPGTDNDSDGDRLTVIQFTVDSNGDGNPETITVPAGGIGTTPLTDASGKAIGTLAIGSDGVFTFTPALAYKGPVPVASYTISDGTDSATASLTLADVPNTPPVALDDTVNVAIDTLTATGNVLQGLNGDGLDTDGNNDTLTVTQFLVDTNGDGIEELISIPAGGSVAVVLSDSSGTLIGTLTMGSDGVFNLVVNPNFVDVIPLVTYTVSDGTDSSSAFLTIENVPPTPAVNLPPVANKDGPFPVKHNESVSGNVLRNDSDPESDSLTVTTFSIPGIATDVLAGTPVKIPAVGTVVVNPDGSFSFTPEADYAGPVPPITYTVTDGFNFSSAVLRIADVPIKAVDDHSVISHADGSMTGNVLMNDGKSGNGPLRVTQFEISGLGTFIAGVPATIPGVGRLTINPDGSFDFVPDANYSGPVPVVKYTVTDGKTTDTAILTIPDVGLFDNGSHIMLSNPTPLFFGTNTGFSNSGYSLLPFREANPYELPSEQVSPSQLSINGNLLDYDLYLVGSLRNQVVIEQNNYDFSISRSAFQHSKPNEELTFEASRPDGSPLPDWLRFNPKLLRFTGRPPKGAHNVEVMVTAKDRFGNKANATFKVQVNKDRVREKATRVKIDLGLNNTLPSVNQSMDKPMAVAKLGFMEQLNQTGKLTRLNESRALLNSIKQL